MIIIYKIITIVPKTIPLTPPGNLESIKPLLHRVSFIVILPGRFTVKYQILVLTKFIAILIHIKYWIFWFLKLNNTKKIKIMKIVTAIIGCANQARPKTKEKKYQFIAMDGFCIIL